MILIPKDWTIENRRMIVIVRPALEAEKVKSRIRKKAEVDYF